MKQTVNFNYPTEGIYEGTLTGVYNTQNKWSRGLQYEFEFRFTHKFGDDGAPEPLKRPLKYSRAIQITADNEMLHKFLLALCWPETEYDEIDFEIVHGNEVKVPAEMPRMFWVEFSKGASRAAQFKSITPVLSSGVN